MPQPVLGQMDGSAKIDVHLDYRPGREITTDELRSFVNRDVVITLATDMRPLSVRLQVQVLSREGDIVGDVESSAADIRPGEKVRGSEFVLGDWLLDPDFRSRTWVLGPTIVVNHEEQYVPRECEGATHVLVIRVVSKAGEPLSALVKNGHPMMCMTVRR